MIVVVMGPSGAGKTTVGRALAGALGWPFHDADDFHPAENVAHMRAGRPLDDTHRGPWLAALARLVADHAAADVSMVLACSALRRSYRDTLVPAGSPDAVRFVYLRASPELLARRLGARRDHFFDASLLASQLAALEEPAPAEPHVLSLDADEPVDALVGRIRDALAL